MKKSIALTRQQKTAVKNYLNKFADYLKTNDYSNTDDFMNSTKEDYRKYHLGMESMVEQMLHELKSVKTPKQQREIETKRLMKMDAINNHEC